MGDPRWDDDGDGGAGDPGGEGPAPAAERLGERRAMLAAVREMAAMSASVTGRGVLDRRVLAALERVPRHAFVPPERSADAYVNAALPIGSGQTISQPFIVALMSDLARIEPGDRVLEVGTGCGYQAAVLAELAGEVYSVEFLPGLAEAARARLARLGYTHVRIRVGDGWEGWPEHAPYDAVLVTAAAREVPAPLVEQLAPGGRLVIPVGPHGWTQDLRVIEKDAGGRAHQRSALPVAFVPLVHEG